MAVRRVRRRRAADPRWRSPSTRPARDVPDRLAHRGRASREVRAEQVARDPQRQRPGDAVERGGRGPAPRRRRRPEGRPHRAGPRCRAPSPTRNASVPGGRGERVGGDQVLVGHDVRQRGREPGEQEPVHREAGQDHREQRGAPDVGVHGGGEREHQADPDEVRPGQHLAARPPVQEARPTNGPSTLNGSSTTASAPASAPGEGARSGENTTYDASATWNTPSVSWLATRTANSRRNHVPRSRCRRWRSAVTRSSSQGPGRTPSYGRLPVDGRPAAPAVRAARGAARGPFSCITW